MSYCDALGERLGSLSNALAEEQRKLCWLTVSLADGYRRLGQPLKSRAVLEPALEMPDDDDDA